MESKYDYDQLLFEQCEIGSESDEGNGVNPIKYYCISDNILLTDKGFAVDLGKLKNDVNLEKCCLS